MNSPEGEKLDGPRYTSRETLVIVGICSLPGVVINFVPLLVSAMVASVGLSEQQSGFIVSADMAGYTIGTMTAFFLIDKISWRGFTRYSLFLMLLANLLCSQAEGFTYLLGLRFLSGLSGGAITAVMLSVIAQMRNPDAVYGLWFVVMSLITIAGMVMFPYLLETAGLGGAFSALATIALICLPFLNAIPHGATKAEPGSKAPSASFPAVILVVASIFFLTTGIGGSWAFLGQIGTSAGLTVEQVSFAIAYSAAGGVAGGLLAGWVAMKSERLFPVSLSCTGLVATMLLLMMDSPSYLLYAFCCFAFYGLWSFVLPFLLGTLAELERSGRALSLGSTAQGAGLMAGPFLASSILYFHGYNTMLAFASGLIVLCFCLVLLAQNMPRIYRIGNE